MSLAPIYSAFLLAGLIVASFPLSGAGGTIVTDTFVEAVAQIESGGGRDTVGDGGKARGWWQMHEAAWQDTTACRARKGLPIWDYDQAHDPEVAKLYARDYLVILENQIRNATGEEPGIEMIYAAYNLGFGRLRSLNFNIGKARETTRSSCTRLRQLIDAMEDATGQTAVPRMAK